MNKHDRKELDEALTHIERAREIIEALGDAEQEKFDANDNLQNTEQYQTFEQNAETLAEVSSELDGQAEELRTL